MNRISEYIKSVGGIQQEQWKFYYGPTGIDKVERFQNEMQNLTIDYTTDTNDRILSAAYNETGGFNGNYYSIYDNYGNISDLVDDDGNSVKGVLTDLNNMAIDTRYDPNDIDDPFTYRTASGFIGIELWDDGGTAHLQGHLVIPNPWGDVSTNGTTTTTTDDTTDKDGGDDEEPCRDPDEAFKNCMANCYEEKTGRTDWRGDWDAASEYEIIMFAIGQKSRGKVTIWVLEGIALIISTYFLHPLFSVAVGIGLDAFLDRIRDNLNKSITDLEKRRDELLKDRPWLKDNKTRYEAYWAIRDCYDKCEYLLPPGGSI